MTKKLILLLATSNIAIMNFASIPEPIQLETWH